MKKIHYIMLLVISLATGFASRAAATESTTPASSSTPDIIEKVLGNKPKIPVDSTVVHNPLDDEMVIVGSDTISIILPQKNYGRYDRGLYNYLFIPRGQWSFGLTASYGEFSSDDVQILAIIKDLDLGIKAYSIKPSISYA
ncbi:MAG: hypothetical protein K2G21_09595, partial [Muribaculaceae bacterium]|nr:hypothetical protein [Muribaculaceae bacterium]